ncbi:MAG: hypothetical protein IJ333_09730 [Clostridia bacterium]|nr:hypothetical protein [Clostridia bacterium]
MKFEIYTQKELLADENLTNYVLDSIIENLSYLFGDDMGTPENRKLFR